MTPGPSSLAWNLLRIEHSPIPLSLYNTIGRYVNLRQLLKFPAAVECFISCCINLNIFYKILVSQIYVIAVLR